MQMHVNTPSQCAPARRSSVLMRYWEPHWSYAVRVDCAHLQAENDALHDRLQQCHDHAAKAQPHKCWLSCARSTATLSSQALREDEGVAATSRAAPILSVDFGKSDPPSPLVGRGCQAKERYRGRRRDECCGGVQRAQRVFRVRDGVWGWWRHC